MKRLKILIPILLLTPTYQVLAYNPSYGALGDVGTSTCPENYRSVTSSEASDPSFYSVLSAMDHREEVVNNYLIDDGNTLMVWFDDTKSTYVLPVPVRDFEKVDLQVVCYLTDTTIMERFTPTERTVAPATLGTQYSLSSRTASKNWVVRNVKEYKEEIIDHTAIAGSHPPINIGDASELGEMELLSEISKVFSEDSPVSIPKNELKVTKDSLKLPNSLAGTVKDGLESMITLDELLTAQQATANEALRQNIDDLMTEMAKDFSDGGSSIDKVGTKWDGSLLSKHKETLKNIPSSDGNISLYNRINVRLQNTSPNKYKEVATRLDNTMKQYRSSIGYKPGKKLSSYSASAKPKVKFLKVAKGVTSSLSVAGDIIGFALDIALMMEEQPDQFVYVGAAATNKETANGYADSVIREALAIKGISETYKARTKALAKAIQVLNPVFLPKSEFLDINEKRRWTNILWILNEKALLEDLDKGQVLFGDYTDDGTRTQWYPEKLPDNVEPLSSELHNVEYGVKQSSTLVAMLGTVESGDDYNPLVTNTVAANAFNTYAISVRSEINSKSSQEAFSWALNEYFVSITELTNETKRFKAYSTLYKAAVHWALFEAANNNFLNKDIVFYSQNFSFIYNKVISLSEYYEELANDANPVDEDTLIANVVEVAEGLLQVIEPSLESLTDNQVLLLLETIQQQANTEVFGRNQKDSWYQLFQLESESQIQNTARLVDLFKYARGAISEDSTIAINKANTLVGQSLNAAGDITENWIASDVFEVKGNSYTPLGAMDQIVFEAASGGETGPYAYDRVNNTVGDDVRLHSYFFSILNHPIYRNLVRERDIKYPHFRGWYGTATSQYDSIEERVGWPFPDWKRIDLSAQKLVNQVAMPIVWEVNGGVRVDTATFGMPLPTKGNVDSIGDVSAYGIMASLGSAITHHRDTNQVSSISDKVNSIQSYEGKTSPRWDDTWKWYTWND